MLQWRKTWNISAKLDQKPQLKKSMMACSLDSAYRDYLPPTFYVLKIYTVNDFASFEITFKSGNRLIY